MLRARNHRVALQLALAFILMGGSRVLARRASVAGAVEGADIVVVGTLTRMHRGSFRNPSARSGELVVSKVLKGTPPATAFRIKLPDHWGPPSLSAQLGTAMFWVFVIFCGLAVLPIVLLRRFRSKWAAAFLSGVCLLFALQAASCTFSGQVKIEDWPRSPSEMVGEARLWVVHQMETGTYVGGAYQLHQVEYWIGMIEKDPDKYGLRISEETTGILSLVKKHLRSDAGK
jgi:hypothetical protein